MIPMHTSKMWKVSSAADTRRRKASVARLHRSDHDRQCEPGNVGPRSAQASDAVTGMGFILLDGESICRLSAFVEIQTSNGTQNERWPPLGLYDRDDLK